jgi:hypothetical protein
MASHFVAPRPQPAGTTWWLRRGAAGVGRDSSMEKSPPAAHRCAACNQPFRGRSQSPRQAYCARVACQRERRRRWLQAKRVADPDYRYNQRNAQRAWSLRHPLYWREYRKEHPKYCEQNRDKQRERGRFRSTTPMYVVIPQEQRAVALVAGVYKLIPTHTTLAKIDASASRISWVFTRVGLFAVPCKEST